MLTKACQKLGGLWMGWRRRHRTRDDFPDGSSLSEIHRYGIRYTSPSGAYVDIGYEATTDSKAVWLIHLSSLSNWDAPRAVEISEKERQQILEKLVEYSEARRRPSRVVP